MKIALIGNKASGKTRVARHLQKKYKFKLMEMQDGVEKIYRSLYYNEKYARVPWEKRIKIYDLFYDLEPTTWTHFLEKRLLTTTLPDIVIPDVRYVTEVERLRELGFIIVRVTSVDGVKMRVGKSLLDAKEGTVLLREYFNKDSIKVDAAITSTTLGGTRETVDYLMEQLKLRSGT